MFLKLLREALAQRSLNVKVARDIEEGKDLQKTLPLSVETDVELQFDSRWWLEKFFDRHDLSFVQGVFLFYVVAEIPRLFFLPFIAYQSQGSFLLAYVSAFFGDMFFPFALLLIHSLHKSLTKLRASVNNTLRRNEFVAPPTLVFEEELASSGRLAKLDKEYRNRYVKPVMIKTFQLGINLSFDKSYMLGSGLIAASLFFALMFMRFVLHVLPENLFTLAHLAVPNIGVAYTWWVLAMTGFDWFIVGMLTWTVFLVFLLSIQISGNTIRIRPFESIKEYYAPTTNVILKTSFTVTFLTAWLSPFLLIWSLIPAESLFREAARMFVESVLVVMIPVIVISFLVPFLKIHKGMSESRERLLRLKRYQLEDLKKEKIRKSDPNKYLRIEEHLIQDYKDIQRSPVWLLNVPQMLELSGTVLLPIVTFLISVRV